MVFGVVVVLIKKVLLRKDGRRQAYRVSNRRLRRNYSYSRKSRAWMKLGAEEIEKRITQRRKVRLERLSKTEEEAEEILAEPEPEKVRVQEVYIYGIENRRTRDRREYGIFEMKLDVPVGVSSQQIADFLERKGIYNVFESNDSGKPNLNERRVKIAGMRTARMEDLGDWQSIIEDRVSKVVWRRDRQRGEKRVVLANRKGHQRHIEADDEVAKGMSE
jgi:hypothetical protein